jgi:ABC-type transport system involved in multi-copper enzyme maturation permease subunit
MTFLSNIYYYSPTITLVLVAIAFPLILGTLLIYYGQYAYENGKYTNKFIGYNNGMCIAGFVFIGIATIISIYIISKTIISEYEIKDIRNQNRARGFSF